jgi:MFS family permease
VASTPADGSTTVSRNLRWNFGAAVIDAGGWGVGMSLVSATTILPLFVSKLTDSPLAVGMIQAVMLFGWLLPGILVSGWVEALPRVKRPVFLIALVERCALALVAPFCLFFGDQNRQGLLIAFFAAWFVMNSAMGANLPGYYKLIAKTIPPEYRGRLYGVGGAASGVVGVGAALLAEWYLGRWAFPAGFAACFLTAALVQTLTCIPIALMREPEQPAAHAPAPSLPHQRLRLILDDRRLLWLCVAVVVFSLNQMAAAFYTLFAIERMGASDVTVAGFTAVVTGAKAVAFLLVGWLGDRFGNRAAIQVSSLFGTLAAALAWGAPDLSWLYVVFMLNEIAVQGWGVCAMNYVLELCPTERAGTYTAVFGVFTGPARVLFPLAGGVMVGIVGYSPVFVAGVVGGLLAMLLIAARLPEPRNEAALT